MKEKIVQFGPENNMIGIVSQPAKTNQSKPAILILNSGLIHRVGPYRMGVDLARRLSQKGFLVLRFDLPNIGDSLPHKTLLDHKQRSISDIASAMDDVSRRYSIKEFVSVGLCTGAMNAHIIAVADDRIKAAIMLDAYSYPTKRFYYNRYKGKLAKLLNPVFIYRILKDIFISASQSKPELLEDVSYWDMPEKKQIENDLVKLVNRKVGLLYFYTGGLAYHYNYAEQLKENFKKIKFGQLLKVFWLAKTDHTFTLQRDRDHMFNLLTDWLEKRFPNA